MAPTPPPNDGAAISDRSLERLILDRELVDRRVLSLEAEDGTRLLFHLRTLTAAETQQVVKRLDAEFPAPPVKVISSPAGGLAAFDLADLAFKERFQAWQSRIGKALLGETLGIPLEAVEDFSRSFPQEVVNGVQSMVQLLNGVHSEPVRNLVKDALWAPEVLTWLETYKGDDANDLVITDTPLFREMEAMVAAGLTRAQWQALTAKDRLLYMEWFDSRQAKEAYANWHAYKKPKGKPVHGQRT